MIGIVFKIKQFNFFSKRDIINEQGEGYECGMNCGLDAGSPALSFSRCR